MPWGRVTITYNPTGYTQNYKRDNVSTHIECANMVAAAVNDSVARIIANNPNLQNVQVGRANIAQAMVNDPGLNYRVV